MSVSTVEWGRIDLSATSLVLAAGDVLAITLFVSVGEYTHGYDPIADVGRVVGTLLPFLIGWFLVAGVGGLYTPSATSTIRRTVATTLGGWIVAVAVAQLLRSTAVFHGNAALTFAIVSIGIGGTLLCLWRTAVTLSQTR
jgi:hypothetical protein